jgi:hypothetical protein
LDGLGAGQSERAGQCRGCDCGKESTAVH